MMTTYYLRLALLPTILLTVVLLVIRSQPYDGRDLRTMLLVEKCSSPCFMGIQLGVTTIDEAAELVEASGWAENIDNQNFNNQYEAIYWDWNDKKPTWIIGYIRGSVVTTDDVVRAIILHTNFSLHETLVALGKPHLENVDTAFIDMSNNKRLVTYVGVYKFGLQIETLQHCGDTDMLNKLVTINLITPNHEIPESDLPVLKVLRTC